LWVGEEFMDGVYDSVWIVCDRDWGEREGQIVFHYALRVFDGFEGAFEPGLCMLVCGDADARKSNVPPPLRFLVTLDLMQPFQLLTSPLSFLNERELQSVREDGALHVGQRSGHRL
jgi:hypothetical protein